MYTPVTQILNDLQLYQRNMFTEISYSNSVTSKLNTGVYV